MLDRSKRDVAAWDAIIDRSFELDEEVPFLSDMGDDDQGQDEPRALGGEGSGNFGHAGRPGEVGGSAPGGGGGGENSSTAVAKRHNLDMTVVAEIEERIRGEATTQAERDYADEMAVAEAIAKRDLEDGDTRSRYINVDGTYNEERQQLHTEIFRRFFEDHKAKHGSLPPTGLTEPVVTFMAGMPGAGKSTAAKDLEDSPNAIAINPDVMKTYLPEFNNGLGSTVVQQESGDLADMLMELAARQRMNIIIDGTMKRSGGLPATFGDGAVGKMAKFKDLGYRVETRFVDVNVDQSIQNVVTRFHQDFAKEGRGRYVPTSFTRSLADTLYGTAPRASFEIAKNSSYRGKPLIDAWTHTRGWTGDKATAHKLLGSSGTLTPKGGNSGK